MSNQKTIFSGAAPSGDLQLGQYFGAVKQWVDLQNEGQNYFCVVDLHAITVPQDPELLKERTRQVAAMYLACGIDPEKSVVFVQSQNQDHAELAWILNCFTPMTWLERMIQFKEKSVKQKEIVSVGLFDYPVLMAADILLYDATDVPVGEDQKQHVELARDIAKSFNGKFGMKNHPQPPARNATCPQLLQRCRRAHNVAGGLLPKEGGIFVVPQAKIMEMGARVMSLQDPKSKMSKSDKNKDNVIFMNDNADSIRNKIKKAVTDSGSEVKFGADKPALSNLLTIYSLVSGKPIENIEAEYTGRGYGDFKKDLAENVVEFLKPIQTKYQEIINNKDYLDKILADGLEKAREVSSKKVREVKEVVGLGL